MRDIQGEIDKKESIKVVKKVSDRLEKFAAIEHIDQLINVFLPKVQQFSDQVTDFMADNEDVKNCVRKFDEDISIKANKSSLIEMNEEIERRFIPLQRWDQVLDGFDDLRQHIKEKYKEMESHFEDFRKKEEQSLDILCEELLANKYSKYDHVLGEFKKFFNQEDLSIRIDSKADLKMVNLMEIDKASRKELDEARNLIDSLNNRVKHLANLLNEISESIRPVRDSLDTFKESTKNSILAKIENIQ